MKIFSRFFWQARLSACCLPAVFGPKYSVLKIRMIATVIKSSISENAKAPGARTFLSLLILHNLTAAHGERYVFFEGRNCQSPPTAIVLKGDALNRSAFFGIQPLGREGPLG